MELLVLPSEISGLPRFHALVKVDNLGVPYPLCPISRVRMLQTKWASAPRKIETALGFVVLESYGAPAIIDCSGQIPKHRHAEDARKPHSHRVAHLLEADC